MYPHHSDQMFQRSQVSRIALWRCSLNVFVFVIVFVFVFVYDIVFLLVRSCPLITLIKCFKGHKSLGSLCCCVFLKRSLTQWVSEWVSDNVTYWAVGWTAKNMMTKHKNYAFLWRTYSWHGCLIGKVEKGIFLITWQKKIHAMPSLTWPCLSLAVVVVASQITSNRFWLIISLHKKECWWSYQIAPICASHILGFFLPWLNQSPGLTVRKK